MLCESFFQYWFCSQLLGIKDETETSFFINFFRIFSVLVFILRVQSKYWFILFRHNVFQTTTTTQKYFFFTRLVIGTSDLLTFFRLLSFNSKVIVVWSKRKSIFVKKIFLLKGKKRKRSRPQVFLQWFQTDKKWWEKSSHFVTFREKKMWQKFYLFGIRIHWFEQIRVLIDENLLLLNVIS